MTGSRFAACLLSALASACASAVDGGDAPALSREVERHEAGDVPPSPDAADSSETAASAEVVADQTQSAMEREPEGTRGSRAGKARSSNDVELAVWNAPSFRRRFAESYIAETDIEPRVTEDEREQLQEVLQLISDDRLDEAAGLLRERGGDGASAVFDFMLANIHFQEERLDEAAAAYRVAVEKYPKFRRAWRNLGLIHVRQGEFEEALPVLTRVVELGGGDAIAYGLLGYAYSRVENDLAAESAYRIANLLDPETMDWKMGLARSFFKQERYADAVALCDTLIAEDPDRADLWLLQANAYIGLGQPLNAAENYELVDDLGKSTADSLNMLGDIYVNEELFDLAVHSYVRAMEENPGADIERALRAARVLAARGALDETRDLVERIDVTHNLLLTPEQRKELLRLEARLAMAEGAGDEEARVLEELIALDPLDGEALILLGQYKNRVGDPEQAIFYYERAAAIEAFEADAKVRHAQLLVGQGRYAEALPLLRRAQTLNPRDNIQEYLEQVERVSQQSR